MLLHVLVHHASAGRLAPCRHDLDSSRTFAVMFGTGTAEQVGEAEAGREARLSGAVPSGCSTAGEVGADWIGRLTGAIARFVTLLDEWPEAA